MHLHETPQGTGTEKTSCMSLESQIIQFLFTGIAIGSIYAMVALGFNIIYNATGILNFAQGEFVMLGGLLMVWLSVALGLPMPLAFILTIAAVMAIGALFERVAIYPLKKPSVLILIIITLAGSIIFKGGAMLLWGKHTYSLPHFSSEQPLTSPYRKPAAHMSPAPVVSRALPSPIDSMAMALPACET